MTNTTNNTTGDTQSPISESQRTETLISIAEAMVQRGCDTEAVFAALININQRRCRPPLGYEQLQGIAVSIIQSRQPRPQGVLLEGDFPDQIAEAFAASGPVRLFNHQGQWISLCNNRYVPVELSEVRKHIYQFGSNCIIRRRSQSASVIPVYDRLKMTPYRVGEILDSLSAHKQVWIRSQHTPPVWLKESANRPDPQDMIALRGALLDISAEHPVRFDPTEDFFTLHELPIKYDPAASCPLWLKKLSQWFTRPSATDEQITTSADQDRVILLDRMIPDQRSIDIVQEWFGYALTHQDRFPNILGLTGPGCSGKGVITKVLHALTGRDNMAALTMTHLAGKESLQFLVHKRLACVHCAHLNKKDAQTRKAAERLFNIAGQEFGLHDKVNTKVVLITDFLSQLIDATGLLNGRIICLQTTQSFYGRQDIGLAEKLLAELPGIFNWAMEGFFRLKKRGFFLESPADEELRWIASQDQLSLGDFINECCDLERSSVLQCQDLYDGYKHWITQAGFSAPGRTQFYWEFQQAFPDCVRAKVRLSNSDTNPVWVFRNMDWKPQRKAGRA